jgi:hypothetical protein
MFSNMSRLLEDELAAVEAQFGAFTSELNAGVKSLPPKVQGALGGLSRSIKALRQARDTAVPFDSRVVIAGAQAIVAQMDKDAEAAAERIRQRLKG